MTNLPNRGGNSTGPRIPWPRAKRLPLSFRLVMPAVIVLTIFASGLYTVETGHVAVEKTLGRVNMTEVGEGMHWRAPWITQVTEYSAKTVTTDLNDMRPKASDNLSLQDLDVSVLYRVRPDQVAELAVKYAAAHAPSPEAWLPAYEIVYREARGAIYDCVSEIESLKLHRERDALAGCVEARLHARFEQLDPGVFTVDRIVIRALNTDPTIEQAIQLAVQNQKRLEAKEVEVSIAEKDAEIEIKRARGIAEANQIINKSLTVEYLQHEVNEALKKFGENGCPATIIPANMSGSGLILDTTGRSQGAR